MQCEYFEDGKKCSNYANLNLNYKHISVCNKHGKSNVPNHVHFWKHWKTNAKNTINEPDKHKQLVLLEKELEFVERHKYVLHRATTMCEFYLLRLLNHLSDDYVQSHPEICDLRKHINSIYPDHKLPKNGTLQDVVIEI